MLTYRVGSAGSPAAAVGMAEYLAKEAEVPGLSETLAAYYGSGLMSDERSVTAGVPRQDMDRRIAELLGIDPTKPLTTMQVANLLAGNRTDGQAIPGKKQQSKNQVARIAYVDFTLSAPKSFSVAWALAPTDAERAILDKCHRDAVDKALGVIAGIVGTVGKGGTGTTRHVREPGHVAIITFDHFTARPVLKNAKGNDTELVAMPATPGADMQRHTHAIIPAVAVTDDGRVGAIHQHAIRSRVHEIGSLYQAFLATNLRRHGVEVELDRREGLQFNERMARLTAVPQGISDLFSRRSTDGERLARETAAELGLDFDAMGPEDRVDLLRRAIKVGRGEKEAGPDIQGWVQRAKGAGYVHRSVLRPGEGRGPLPPAERLRIAYETALPLLEEQFSKRAVIEGHIPRVAAAKAFIETGIREAWEVNVVTRAFRSEGVRQDGRKTSIHWALDPQEKFARLTTQLSVEQEAEAIAILSAAAKDRSAVLAPEALARAVEKVSAEGYDFTSEHGRKQLEVMRRLASAGRAAVAIGAAGSGKSSLLRPLIEAWHEDGREVYGVTLAWRQTAGLVDAGIVRRHKKQFVPDKGTLGDAGLEDQRTFAMTPFLSALEKGDLKLDAKSVVVIDELALVGTRQILRLAQRQKEQGFQIVAIGDDKQNQPIEAGATIDLCRRAFGSENIPELLSTIRQLTERDRETSLMFRDGRAAEALERKNEDGTLRIVPGGYREAIGAIVDLWFERRAVNAQDPKYTIGITAPTNDDGRAIGEAIRERRRAAGEIGSTDLCEINAADQAGAAYSLTLAAGDRVRLFDRVFGTRVDQPRNMHVGNNGSVLEVVSADATRLRVRTAKGIEADVEWGAMQREGSDRIRLSRGDAVTIDARQSETLTEHITAMPSGSAAVNGFKAYVAESRHRRASWIVTSQGAEKLEIEGRRAIGDPRNVETEPVKVKAAVLDNMARNLSRQPKKTLAVEFLDRAVKLRSGTVDAFQAAWFHMEHRMRRKQTAKPMAAPKPVAQPKQEATMRSAQTHKRPMTPEEAQLAFADELAAAGLRLKGAPIMDGTMQRAAVDGDKGRKTSASYVGHLDGVPAGYMHNFKTGFESTWTGIVEDDKPAKRLTPAEIEAARQQRDAVSAAREKDRQEKEAAVAGTAEKLWEGAKPASNNHPYLVAKGVPSYGLREGQPGQVAPMTETDISIAGRLLVPMRDGDRKLWNLQMIDETGRKYFLPGRKQGLFAALGQPEDGRPIVVAEGYATAATLRQTTALTSVVALDSGNLLPVAMGLRASYPHSPIVFGADNDHRLPQHDPPLPNVGLEKATSAAGAVQGMVVAPAFRPHEMGSDWNDYAKRVGVEAVRAEIRAEFKARGIETPEQPPPRSVTQAERDAARQAIKPTRGYKARPPQPGLHESQTLGQGP